MSLNNYYESGILAHLFRDNSLAKPPVWLALCTASISDTDTGGSISEVPEGNGYTRLAASGNSVWSVPAQDSNGSGYITNIVALSFGPSTSAWGTVTHIALLDASGDGAGNIIAKSSLRESKSFGVSDIGTFSTGSIIIGCN